jgi:hypothetical protein
MIPVFNIFEIYFYCIIKPRKHKNKQLIRKEEVTSDSVTLKIPEVCAKNFEIRIKAVIVIAIHMSLSVKNIT